MRVHEQLQLAIAISFLGARLAEAQELESVLDFAEYALWNAARMRQGFGTATISPVFNLLEPSTSVKGSMASPPER